MSTAKEIKDLIDKLNKRKERKGKISLRIEKRTIDKIGNLFLKEIRRDFMKETTGQRDYYKVANETLKKVLEEIEEMKKSEQPENKSKVIFKN